MRHDTATGKVVCTCISTLPAAVERRFYRFGRVLALFEMKPRTPHRQLVRLQEANRVARLLEFVSPWWSLA